jgi:hypothetical protein
MMGIGYSALWVGCMNEPNSALRWIECHPAIASYIQAIGTVSAILSAVGLPWLLRYRRNVARNRARERRTTAAVSRLWGDLSEIRGAIDACLHTIDTYVPPPDRRGWMAFLEKFKIPIPSQLSELIRRNDLDYSKYSDIAMLYIMLDIHSSLLLYHADAHDDEARARAVGELKNMLNALMSTHSTAFKQASKFFPKLSGLRASH